MTLEQATERLGNIEALDRVAEPLSSKVSSVVSHGPVKDLLSGTWLGHPLHPLLTDIPIGAWTSAVILDLIGGKASRPAADLLVATGVLAAVPTAVSGLADWSDYFGAQRRVGLVHAAANVAATGCFGLSLVARLRGRRSSGVLLGLLGAATATVGGYLGGHLSYTQGVNVNRNAWEEWPDEWTDVMAEADLADDAPAVARIGDNAILVLRHDGRVHALADRCSHAGGPLHEGPVADGCVTCPWHGSTFRLADGAAVHGPASVAQPHFEVRIEDGRVLVRGDR